MRPVADAFEAANQPVYLVGGIVRDVLLGRDLGPDHDLDLTTPAHPSEVKAIIAPIAEAVWTQGERFGTIGAKVGGRTVEITTHRSEIYDPDSRKPEVAYGDAVEVDLARRDFTVNAMALRVPEPELIDPFGGAADLAAKVLRTPGAPEASFTDDPLRMLRAARFIAGYGLEPVPELVAAVRDLAPRLDIVSAERIRDELDKLLVVEDPSAGLWFVVDTGLADVFLPELPAMRLEQDPIHHHKDVLAHTIAVVANTRPRRIVRLAALLHDVGKPKTRSFTDGGVTFHHHDVKGARLARKRLQALRFDSDTIASVTTLIELHLRFFGYAEGAWTDSAVRRYVRDAGDELSRLHILTRADVTTRNKRKAARLAAAYDDIERRIDELAAAEELGAMRPALDGNRIQEVLGIRPGPEVGKAYRYLLDLRLDEGVLDEADAEARLRAWWAAQGAAAATE